VTARGRGRGLSGVILAVVCLAPPSCGTFMAAPYYEEPQIDREMLRPWGEDGAYCFGSFSERVKGSNALAPFVAAQDEKCKQNDGAACLDRAEAHLGGCGGAEKNRARAMELFLRACELGQPDGCTTYVESTPPRRWGIFSNSKRDSAATRAADLVQKACLAGDVERCALLDRWHRGGRYGLSPGRTDGAERTLAAACLQGREPACRLLATREASLGNRDAVVAIHALHCGGGGGGWGCAGLTSLGARATADGDATGAKQILRVADALERNGRCADNASPERAAPARNAPAPVTDQDRRCIDGDAPSCDAVSARGFGHDMSARQLLQAACHAGREESCQGLAAYSLRIDDRVTAIGTGALHCGQASERWGCDALTRVSGLSTGGAALPDHARARLNYLFCALL